jgi:hypothetical protein
MDTPNQKHIDALVKKLRGSENATESRNGRASDYRGVNPSVPDEEIIEKARSERGGKFDRLWRGDTSDYGHDHSDADDGFVHKLWFYTQDEEQVRRIHGASGLSRSKSETRSDYLSRSIKRARKNVTEFYSWPEQNPPQLNSEQSQDGEPGFADSDYFHHIDRGFGGNKKSNESILPIKSIEEVIAEAGERVDWIIEDLLARGALTEFSGLAKRGGKTTFWCHAIAACAREDDHGGFPTTPARYLYLTEQGNNFAEALRESGLVEYSDRISVVQFKDVSARGWDKLIRQAGAEAKKRGFDVLVIDTFAVFAGLKGSEENDAGPVADRMRVLRLVAQKYNIAVVLIRHAGKDGTPRGSSAFEAEADICVTLSRPEGRHAPSVRHIAGIGRYGEWERNIQLVDGRYISLGTDNKIEFNKAVRHIKAVLPDSEENGMKKSAIMESLSGPDKEEISASTIDRALAWLVKKEAVGEKELTHSRGKPKIYWLLPEVYFHQTPSPNGGNKTNPDFEAAWADYDKLAEVAKANLAGDEVAY